MKVYEELNLRDFQAWSGAIETKNKIIDAGKEEEFEELIEELYPEGIDATDLNDYLWFDSEEIYDCLGIESSEEEEEEE